MPDPAKLALFIDYQNVYRRARDAFHLQEEHYLVGQINPLKVGRLLASRENPGARLVMVQVYRGEPVSQRDPKGYAACQRQVQSWRALDPIVRVETRPLRYPDDPNDKPVEKGIDVKLALDFLDCALKKSADVLVLFSADTDLVPALEMVYERYEELRIRAHSAAWNRGSRLMLKRPGFWCHTLTRADFEKVRDDRDYTRELRHEK